jgi:hypothetical protein
MVWAIKFEPIRGESQGCVQDAVNKKATPVEPRAIGA